MALKTNKLAAATAVAAALSLLATPVAARDYYGHHRHHDDGIDTGDVIAGVVLLGAIAAIAGAADRHNDGQVRERDRDYDYDYPLPDPDVDRDADPNTGYDYRGANRDYGTGYSSRGIDRAVDMCVDQVQRGDNRVATVDSVARSGEGWQVSGNTDGGLGYSCTIGDDGSIGDVFVGGAYQQSPDGQYGDDYYANARASQDRGDDYYSNFKQ